MVKCFFISQREYRTGGIGYNLETIIFFRVVVLGSKVIIYILENVNTLLISDFNPSRIRHL